MKQPYPSSPTRPPKAHFYFTVYADGTEVHFETQGYAELFAAARTYEELTRGHKVKIKNNTATVCTDSHRLTIKGVTKTILDLKLAREEQAWTPRIPKRIQIWSHITSSQPEEPNAGTVIPPTKKTPKQAPRHKTQKASPKGMISVAEIAATMNIQPNKARGLLRKAKIQKPKSGWTFKKNDPIIEQIREVLKQG